MTLPVAVLVSGRGSNLAALIDACKTDGLPITFGLVASDKADAPALRHAETHGIPTLALDPKGFASRREFDEALFANVAASGAQLVVLAGYMRIIDGSVTAAWAGRMINIHPSLLPRHKGLHTHQRAIEAGDAEHGASVHLVNAELDGGAVIAQTRVPVRAGDAAESLAARVLQVEHPLYVEVLRLLAAGRLGVTDGQPLLAGHPAYIPLSLEFPHS